MAEDYRRFRFCMYPISELPNYTGLERYFNETDGVDYEVDRGTCEYGQYFAGVLETDSGDLHSVYFVVDNCVVRVILDRMEWSTKYFRYFKFETVSLK